MKRFLLSLVILLTPLTVIADEADIWSMLPDDTLGFVMVNNPTDLSKKVTEFGAAMNIPTPDPLVMLGMQFDAVEQIDTSRPAVFAAMPDGDDILGHDDLPGTAVVMLPVKDFEAFVKKFGAKEVNNEPVPLKIPKMQVVAIEYNGYALITDAADTENFDRVKTSSGKIAKQFAELRERLDASDAVVGLTEEGVQLLTKFASQAWQQGPLRELKKELAGSQDGTTKNAPPKAMADMILKMAGMFDRVITLVEDNVLVIGYGLNVEEDAVKLTELTRYRDGKLGQTLGEIAPVDVADLSQIPAGKLVMIGGGAMPEVCVDPMMKLSRDLMLALEPLYGWDEKTIDQMMEMNRPMMADAASMQMFLQIPKYKKAPLYAGMGGLLTVRGDAKAYIANYIVSMRKMSRMLQKDDDSFIQFNRIGAIEIDGQPGVVLDMAIDMDSYMARIGVGEEMPEEAQAQMRQMIDQMMEQMYGITDERGIRVFLAVVDDHTIAFSYVSRNGLNRVIELRKDPSLKSLADNKALSATIGHFPDDAQWFGVLDLSGYLQMVVQMIEPTLPPVMNSAGIFPFEDLDLLKESSPIGVSMTARECETEGTLVVPAATIRSGIQAGMQAFGQMQKMQKSQSGLPEVSGVVTLDGVPLQGAGIMFTPKEGVKRSSFGVTDDKGKYEMQYTGHVKGVLPGEHTVKITSENGNVPAKYGEKSELKITVVRGTNTIDFDLQSK